MKEFREWLGISPLRWSSAGWRTTNIIDDMIRPSQVFSQCFQQKHINSNTQGSGPGSNSDLPTWMVSVQAVGYHCLLALSTQPVKKYFSFTIYHNIIRFSFT